jgi:hypothetical protein
MSDDQEIVFEPYDYSSPIMAAYYTYNILSDMDMQMMDRDERIRITEVQKKCVQIMCAIIDMYHDEFAEL